jgi:hypothetical protein
LPVYVVAWLVWPVVVAVKWFGYEGKLKSRFRIGQEVGDGVFSGSAPDHLSAPPFGDFDFTNKLQ